MEKLLLVDGNNILHRAYHGLPLLKTKDGRYTNAVFGFLKMFHKIMEQEEPTYVAICFDKGKDTFRHRLFADYKAQRKPTDPELVEQFPLIREVMALNGFRCLESEEYEADDIMGSLAKKAAAEGLEAIIFSGDKDLLQVLDDDIVVVSGKKQLTDLKKTTAADFVAAYGLEPKRLIDLKGLMGDASDNYPGVKGVGEKTALKLLTDFGSLEALYDHIDELPANKLREKLENDRESAFLSKKLATIETAMPWDEPWTTLIPTKKDIDRLLPLYRDLEFRQYVAELEKEAKEEPGGGDLFSDTAQKPPFTMTAVADLTELGDTALGLILSGDDLFVADAAHRGLRLDIQKDRDAVAALLGDGKIAKVCAESKSLHRYALKEGIAIDGDGDDIAVMAYLDEANVVNDKASTLISHYLKIPSGVFGDDKELAEASLLLDLKEQIAASLATKDMTQLYREVELPLVAVLADMEFRGIRVDKAKLTAMSAELGADVDELVETIRELAGEEFNVNSTQQLARILFDKLGLPKGKKTKTGYSTNSDVLEKLKGAHPIVEKLLEYRQVAKIKSTYADALAELIDDETGRIHTRFLQTVTATGRLSSADPNLKNIPIRVEAGRKIRKAFTAGDEHHVLVAADYSQIELRLLAHFSEDPALLQSFRQGEDIHARTAGEVFGVAKEDVTAEMRRAAKAINFGIIYGISGYSLANDLGVSRGKGQEYIDNYFARYPKVKAYLDQTIADAEEKGYAETLMGRRRRLPDILSRNHNLRAFAQRTAMNTPLQGSAADIIKMVMVRFHDALDEGGFNAKLILQVHDELIVDCDEAELPAVKALLKEVMENTVTLKVPLVVDCKIGHDWYHMEKE